MNDKIENALNECRILLLVAEVVLAFQYQSVFQPGFEKLPISSQYLQIAGLFLMLWSLLMLVAPVTYHRIVQAGSLSSTFHRYLLRTLGPSLLPFALMLGIEVYVTARKIFSLAAGVASGIGAMLVALAFWYGWEAIVKTRQGATTSNDGSEEETPTPLKDRIRFVLTEARVVLPGIQALLGFQFAAVFTDAFDKLAPSSKVIYFASIAAVALATIFLMAPAAYHRIVENGECTERLNVFSSNMILIAMAFLAVGIGGDVYVVLDRVALSRALSISVTAITLLAFFGLWFGYMYLRRAQIRSEEAQKRSALSPPTRGIRERLS